MVLIKEKELKRIAIAFLFLNQCFAFSQQTISKKYSVLKSTQTSVGSSTVYTKTNKFSVQQSIGQSGIVGKKEIHTITLQQGFLNNYLFFKIDNSANNSFKENFDFAISPNPFINHIKIDFLKKTIHPILIKIYDVNGKIHSSNTYTPSDKIIIPLKEYSIGTYLIQIKSGKNIVTKKILKIE